MEFFGASEKEYDCIFTANASNAIRLVGAFYEMTSLLILMDNHNSVNGLRESARQRNVPWSYVPLTPEGRIDEETLDSLLRVRQVLSV